MPSQTNVTDQTGFEVVISGVDQSVLKTISVKEITLSESLLTPSLATSITVMDEIETNPVKILDVFYNKDVSITVERKINEAFQTDTKMEVKQRIYRIENRIPQSQGYEFYTFQCCDESLLNNAESRVSWSWMCQTPSKVVTDVLSTCVKVASNKLKIESAQPARTYFAENIHPFQVVAQQADVALAGGNDPSFVHFMTYKNFGTHHFESLKKMTQQAKMYDLYWSPKLGDLYLNPHIIQLYEFPCDFDLVTDILNATGQRMSVFVTNPYAGVRSLIGNQTNKCGLGGSMAAESFTDKSSGNGCEIAVEKYALLRQARMMLLDQDKIALRMTVPWNPMFHVGQMIEAHFPNVNANPQSQGPMVMEDYGSGLYLISAMSHTIRAGGLAYTTLDCVSKTVGTGTV
jgi:hypothetical protein